MKIMLSLCLEPGDSAEVEVPLTLPNGETVTLTHLAAQVHVDASAFQSKTFKSAGKSAVSV